MKKKRKKAVPIVREAEDTVELTEEAAESGIRVGDVVVRRPITFGGDGERPGRATRGKVVFVHPAGRFHTVEFEMPGGGKIRESFAGDGRQ